MTHDNMSLFDAIHNQRAIRHFSEQPVSDEAVETMLNAAIRAPSGGNRQPWRFVVICDAALKRRLGQWYLAAWQAATADMEAFTHPYRHGAELAQQMATVPVLILACIDHGEAGSGRSARFDDVDCQDAGQRPRSREQFGACPGVFDGTPHTLHRRSIGAYDLGEGEYRAYASLRHVG